MSVAKCGSPWRGSYCYCQNVKYRKGKKVLPKKAAEKEEEQQRNRLSKKRLRRYHDKKRASVLTGQSMMPTVSSRTFQSCMAKKRAVDKTKNVLTKTPEEKVEIIKNLVCSPQTRKALQERELVKSPEEEKRLKC